MLPAISVQTMFNTLQKQYQNLHQDPGSVGARYALCCFECGANTGIQADAVDPTLTPANLWNHFNKAHPELTKRMTSGRSYCTVQRTSHP